MAEAEAHEGEVVETLATLEVPTKDKKNLAERHAEFEQVLKHIQDFEIEDDDDFEFINGKLKQVKACYKELEAHREAITKPINAALREYNSRYKPSTDLLEKVEKVIKEKMGAFVLAQRLANEAAARATAAAAREGDFDKALVASQSILEETRAKGTTVRDVWEYSVEDLSQVPRKFLALDHSAIKIYIKDSGKDDPKPIPGLKFTRKSQVISR